MDPETLEPLPVERLLQGLSVQLVEDLTSAAEQDHTELECPTQVELANLCERTHPVNGCEERAVK